VLTHAISGTQDRESALLRVSNDDSRLQLRFVIPESALLHEGTSPALQ
jgi:hypothetical protein